MDVTVIKLLFHLTKLFQLFSHKYPAISVKFNAYEIFIKLQRSAVGFREISFSPDQGRVSLFLVGHTAWELAARS